MRHFIAYHNTEKMGHPLQDHEPLRLLTNKAVSHLLQNTVAFAPPAIVIEPSRRVIVVAHERGLPAGQPQWG